MQISILPSSLSSFPSNHRLPSLSRLCSCSGPLSLGEERRTLYRCDEGCVIQRLQSLVGFSNPIMGLSSALNGALGRSPLRPYHVNIRPRAGPRLSLRATPPPRCRPDEYRSERDERRGGLGHSAENEFIARTATDARPAAGRRPLVYPRAHPVRRAAVRALASSVD